MANGLDNKYSSPNPFGEELEQSPVRLGSIARFMGRGALAATMLVIGTAYSASKHAADLVSQAGSAYLKDEYGIEEDTKS